MDWTLSSSVVHWLDNRNTKGTGIAGRVGTLPGYQKDTDSTGSRILVDIKGIINSTIGYDPGCQHYAENIAKFTFINDGAPAKETVMADVESIHSVSSSIDPSDLSQVDVTSAPLISVPSQVENQVVKIDLPCVLHPFYIHKMDSGPVRLMTIAHAFNYHVAVLRDGVRSAVRVGRSRKAETCFLTDVNISWGQQVTVMFQIVSTLMEEVPAFALKLRELRGEKPQVQLMDNPWGHGEDCVAKCNCLDSDRTGAYVHCLIPRTDLTDSTLRDNSDVSMDIATGFTFNDDCGYLGVGRVGSIPFVSEKPGAYSRLLLAVYVRWR